MFHVIRGHIVRLTEEEGLGEMLARSMQGKGVESPDWGLRMPGLGEGCV